MKFILCLLLMLCMFSGDIYALSEKMVVSIPYQNQEQIQDLISQGYDISSIVRNEEVHIVLSQEQFEIFKKDFVYHHIVFTENQMKSNLNSIYSKNNKSINGYHTYDEIVTTMQEYQNEYPDLCQMVELGPSQGKIYYDSGNSNYEEFNNTIYAMKITADVSEENDRPAYYFMGVHHAREPLSAEVCMTIMDDLLTTYINEEDENHPINQTQVWIIPVVNPDGHNVVLSQTDVWHRKTIFDNNNNGQIDLNINSWGYNIDGIDPNRNYEYMWGTSGVSFEFEYPTYPGTHPFAAVEVSYIKELFEEISFIAGISYHTYGNYVLYPYGYAFGKTSFNQDALADLAEQMAAITYTNTQNTNNLTPMPAWELYPCSGTTDDYLYYNYSTLSYTFELATEFIPNAQEVQMICQNNLPAANLLLSRHKQKFLTGIVTSAETGEPLKAEILVYPKDYNNPERLPIFSDEITGRYHYALLPGIYTLKVIADSYQTYITDFEVFENQATNLDVQLENVEFVDLYLNLSLDDLNSKRVLLEDFAFSTVIIEHSRIDTLVANEFGQVFLQDITPGEIYINAQSSQFFQYSSVFNIENTYNNQTLNVEFRQYDFIDLFDDFSNWYAINWIIDNETYYQGNSSAKLNNHFNSNLVSLNPIPTNPDENVYISFMANYGQLLQAYNYIDFLVSEDNQNWMSLTHIYQTDVTNINSGWEYFSFVLPANMYSQLYFKFSLNRFDTDYDLLSDFYLDLFCVSVGNVTVPLNDLVVDPNDNIQVMVYPNPFNPETTIDFTLNNETDISLNIYNVKGQLVNALVNERFKTGKYKIIWDGKNNDNKSLASGIYFYRLHTPKQILSGKLLLLK
ncbi:MAG: M14 family zinc carboxypeptidase [Candidatus Cloacimonetes bacterium]|nr:M14 family zinc carboxypeptidase [Candidatus Cloacimonadota bacterium]